MYESEVKDIVSSPFNLRSDVHLLRKLWHMSAGVVGYFVYKALDITPHKFAYCLLVLSAVVFVAEFLRFRSLGFNRFIMGMMRPFMRESEKTNYTGMPFYALGVALAFLFYEEKIAILGCLFLVFGDPISSFVGILYGKHKILGNKSLQGALAGFLTCYFLSLFYGLSHAAPGLDLFFFAVGGGVVGSLAELFSVNIDDNLTIPIIAGLGLTFLNMLFPVL